ncbi:MAG: hypothetical protein K1X61_05205 [Chitinophagales bacterium]|nr:hypothetical protein [Chitinophagales bacterium]
MSEANEPADDKPETTDTANIQETTEDSAVTNQPATEEVVTTRTSVPEVVTAVLNGAGIGLLLGMLLGLAVSPVVSGIIGVLSGMLAVLLGLDDKFLSPLKSIRIGTFGFFCVGGIVAGMYIRTNNGLMPSREKMLQEYVKVGFSRQQALDFIAYREFNLVPAAWKSGGAAASSESPGESVESEADESTASSGETESVASAAPVTKQQSAGYQFADPNESGAARRNVLYSSEIDASQCYILDMTDKDKPLSQIKNTFEQAGGTWKELADELGKGLPDGVYIEALFSLRDIFCSNGAGGVVKIPKNDAVAKLNSTQSLNEIKKTLNAAGKTWKTIVDKLSGDISTSYQKTLFLSLAKILNHD